MAHDADFVTALAEALQGVTSSRSIGEEWHSFTGIIPLGGVPYNGQMVTRETYPDLWEYVQAQNLVKTEAEWQTLTGDIPYYSDGDGSTSFRMPKITDTIVRGVYAFGTVVNSGDLDVATLATQVSNIADTYAKKTDVPATPNAYVTETWKSGAKWYRKWSDGWIEQGGYESVNVSDVYQAELTFNTGFSSFQYHIEWTVGRTSTATPYNHYLVSRTATAATLYDTNFYGANSVIICWYACGY